MGPIYKKLDTISREIIFNDAITVIIGKYYIHIPFGHVRHAKPGHAEYGGMPVGYNFNNQ